MLYINRSIENEVIKMKKEYSVIMINGPRQVGKTTLLNYLTRSDKQINYVSLDDIKIRTLANDDPELFLRNYTTPLIIDEFQYAPDLLSYIKIKVDNDKLNNLFDNKSSNTLYYLTGSQIFRTNKNINESLAGRVGIIDLHPLSTREIAKESDSLFIPDVKTLKDKKSLKSMSTGKLFDRIIKGSYPEIYKNKDLNFQSYYESYIRTYIERDIRELINIKDETKFLKFISSVAARTSLEYNASDIAENIGVDNKTVDSWMSILSNSNLVYLIQPYLNNNVGRIIKRPKIIFMDTGLACYLTGYIDSITLEKSVYSGQIFETYVISEVIKSFSNHRLDPRKHIYYYRDSNQKEIDLIINYNNTIYPIEIKKSSNPGSSAIKNFDVVNKFNLSKGNGIVLCLCDSIFPIDENNYLVPIEYI